MKIKVKVYNNSKYNSKTYKVAEIIYSNVKSTKLKTISDEEIYKMGFDEVDPYQEYFILTHNDGETSIFRKSFIDAFKM
jgi:hypothetical protein